MDASDIIAWGRSDDGQAGLARISACFPNDPNYGLSSTQITAAMHAMGVNGRSPLYAVYYYLRSGQNVWPSCPGQVSGVGSQVLGSDPAPSAVNPTPALSSDTLLLIGGGLLLIFLLKRWSDS